MPDAFGRYTWDELARHAAEWDARGLPGHAVRLAGSSVRDSQLSNTFWASSHHFGWLAGNIGHEPVPFPDPTGPQIVAHIEQWIAAGHGTEDSPGSALPIRTSSGHSCNLPASTMLHLCPNEPNPSSYWRLVTFDRNPTPTPSKEEPMTTTPDLKTRVATYLASGSVERQDALRHLAGRHYGFFIAADPEEVLTRFLADNPTGACDDGIRRFREGVDFPEPKAPEKAILRIVLDVEITDPPKKFACRPTADGGTVHKVLDAVRAADGIGEVDWLGYETRRGGALQSPHGPTGWPFEGEKTGAAR